MKEQWNPLFPVCLKKGCKASGEKGKALAQAKVVEISRENGVSVFKCGECGTQWKVTEPGSLLETIIEKL